MNIVYRFLLGILLFGGAIGGYIWYEEQQQKTFVLLECIKEELNHHAVSRVSRPVNGNDEGQSWAHVHKMAKNTVVQIFSQFAQFNWAEPYKSPQQGQVSGSGFFIDEDGHLITNAHVIDQARSISIQIPSFGKRRFDVTVVGVSPERDLALLQLHSDGLRVVREELGELPFLQLGDSDSVERADEIMAIGYPLAQQGLKSTTGVVSGREHIDGRYMIQISAPINPGSSGGPSLSRDAQVIGVNSSGITSAQNVGYIIPSNDVSLFLRQLEEAPEKKGVRFLRRPFLGVIFNANADESLTEYLTNPLPGGLYVVEVYQGSPLWKAGVKSGDMIYEINGHRIDQFGEMNVRWSEDKVSVGDYVARLMPGDNIHLVVYRQGKRLEMTSTFAYTESAPIRIWYPGYEDVEYEILGGMVIMPLTLNHLPLFIQKSPEMSRYMDLKHQMEPALLITHIFSDSAASRSRNLRSGYIIKEVNGEQVTTLDEFRKMVKKSLSTGFLTIKTSENVFTALPFAKMVHEEQRLAGTYFYRVTDFVKSLQEHEAI